MIRLRIDDTDLKSLARRLRALEDGQQLRKNLIKQLRAAVKPAADKAKSNVKAMPSHSHHAGTSLRSAVARAVSIQVRLSGRRAGIRVITRKTPGVRDFANAPKRLNRTAGWRHPYFGDKERWYSQRGRPNWFDQPMQDGKDRYKRAVADVLKQTAREVSKRE